MAALVCAQDVGGRDRGEGKNPVLFVRWQRLSESQAIYDAAWAALEAHFGVLSRRRLHSFDRDPERARTYLAANKDAAIVVAFDAPSAKAVSAQLKGAALLQVGSGPPAQVLAITDRVHFAGMLRRFSPEAKRVALFGDTAETLPGLEVVPCTSAASAKGCDLAWIPEGSGADARALRKDLDRMGIPLVTTSGEVPSDAAALSVRPDPAGLGRKLAAEVLAHVREKRPFQTVRVRRTRVVVDLRAARAANHDVPLRVLARADVVRRSP
jgi:hypothetical protein